MTELVYEQKNRVATLIINRPERRNALNAAVIDGMLAALDQATVPDDTCVKPGWKLHQLTGDLAGFWSLRVTGNQRLIFRFDGGDAYDVNLLDYH